MPTSPDVIVIGGGIAGAATAYFLAREGVNVTLLEMESLGHGASGFSFGRLDLVVPEDEPECLQTMRSFSFSMHQELCQRLTEESGVDPGLRLTTTFEVCFTDTDAAVRRAQMARWAKVPGANANWTDHRVLLILEPRLNPAVLGAVAVYPTGILDSYKLTLAFAQAAERRGAVIRNAQATGLARRGQRVTGIQAGGETFPCGAAVIASGPWAGEASEWLGIELPVTPLKGELLCLGAIDPPVTLHFHGECAIHQKADGKLWVAATQQVAGFDNSPTAWARDTLMPRAIRLMPCLESARLELQTACLRPTTPDLLPVIGQAPGWDNVYIATGAHTKGILLGPAMGRATADLILRGKTGVPIGPFSPARFA